MRVTDRLYGELKLPEVAWRLATTCPVLLRLREVRMANIPFLTYPSFTGVTRYEHSLGVAHLAWRWARQNNLDEDIAIALTLAALYHDGATPAFGHLFEEVLSRHGFHHETTLANLLGGRPSFLPGGEHAQVFLGEACRLRSALPPLGQSEWLTGSRIAALASGESALGAIIAGDIDLDNIDNVIRAATAMGLTDSRRHIHPYEIADAVTFENGAVRAVAGAQPYLAAWSSLRKTLYSSILENQHEFRVQTTIKWAIEDCARDDEVVASPRAWRLTEPELTFDHLRRQPFSRMLIDAIRLGRPAPLLFWTTVRDVSPLIGGEGGRVTDDIRIGLRDSLGVDAFIGYYVDKGHRPVRLLEAAQRSLTGTGSDHSLTASAREEVRGIVGAVALPAVSDGIRSTRPRRNRQQDPRATLRQVEATLDRFLPGAVEEVSLRWQNARPPSKEQLAFFSG